MSRRQATAISAALFVTLAFLDWLTGPDYWLGPIYLLAICLPAWTLGTRAGLIMALFCVVTAAKLNDIDNVPALHSAVAWNLAMRVLALVFVVRLVASFRRLHDHAQEQARIDPLTGALTKRGFEERIAHPRIRRGRLALLAYVDLDGFKQINDEHGHAAGDLVLRSFADAVIARLGLNDTFARIGGDEFLLMIPVRDESDGFAAARLWHEQMNATLATLPWPCSCSLGAVALDPAQLSLADIERADRLMYAAKRGPAPRLRFTGAEAAPFEQRTHGRGSRAAQPA